MLSGKLLPVVYFPQSGILSIAREMAGEKAYLCVLNNGHMRRGHQPVLTILLVALYNISHDGGRKYLRTMFVRSRARMRILHVSLRT